MTHLDVELASLRGRRPPRGPVAWLRGLRPFDRRAIREPDSRDQYWANVQKRLAESDHASLVRFRATEPAPRPEMRTPF